jgi:hypothetical protein
MARKAFLGLSTDQGQNFWGKGQNFWDAHFRPVLGDVARSTFVSAYAEDNSWVDA